MQLSLLLSVQIASMVLMILAGYGVAKSGILPQEAGRAISAVFAEFGIPFTLDWERTPVMKRVFGREQPEICTVRTHRSQYSRARRTLDMMGRSFLKNVTIHVL